MQLLTLNMDSHSTSNSTVMNKDQEFSSHLQNEKVEIDKQIKALDL